MNVASSIVEFVSYLRNLGINLETNGEKLRSQAPSGVLTPNLRQQIGERKAEIIAFLQQVNQVKTVPQLPIKPFVRDGKLPLSFAQQRLWFLHQLLPDSQGYNMVTAIHLQGSLNVVALQQSINEIIRRHETLHTTFSLVDSEPAQHIAPPTPIPLSLLDWQHLPAAEQLDQAKQYALSEEKKPFNLATGPLLQTTLLRLSPEEHILLLKMHHIVYDAWSLSIFIRELSSIYAAFSAGDTHQLPDLPIQYADFAVWQRQWLTGDVLEKQLSYWKQQLKAPTCLELPTDKPRPAMQSFQGSVQRLHIDRQLTQKLKQLSQESEATLFMTLLAAFYSLLARYSGQTDIIVGSPIANRNRQEIETLIGFFVNTLVLRADLSQNPTFRELLAQVRQVTVNAYAHQDLPFEMLVEELQPERNLSSNPLVQVGFALQNAPVESWHLAGLGASKIDLPLNTVRFDLELHFWETSAGLEGNFVYSSDLFTDSTIARMVGHFQTLLTAIVESPQQQVSQLPILTQREQQQLLFEWNNTQIDYPISQCIHELFTESVEKTPDAVAVVFEDVESEATSQDITYRELNSRANQLAHYLQSLGVGPEVLVGICLERSLEMVVGLLAILKAGGAYVPLDPNYPPQRLNYMVSDSQMSVILTHSALLTHLSLALDRKPIKIICWDKDFQIISHQNQDNPVSKVQPANLAYVIYTSGSTGQPKGVLIPHLALLNLVFWHLRTFEINSSDRTTQLAGIAFDAAVWELWPYLAAGASIYLVKSELLLSPLNLRDWLISHKITISFLPTPLAEELCLLAWSDTALRIMLTGGDRLNHYPSAALPFKLFNNYGPTENTVVTTSGQVFPVETANNPPSIGRPIANTQVYILDRYLQPVPVGVPGELHIGGAPLARGYLNRTELTADKFIPNPIIAADERRYTQIEKIICVHPRPSAAQNSKSSRLYKTGDRARYLPDGHIEFLGRIDHQVKIRGFRIELGEIEAVLVTHPKVRSTVAIAKEDNSLCQRLVAYIVSHSQPPSTNELRSFLKQKLPDYMVPAVFVFLEALPLNAHGKVDYRALPEPDAGLINTENYIMPSTETEKIIAGVWQKVLQLERVGINDNFFELGGHSLLLIQVNKQLQDFFGASVSIVDMFKYPTICTLGQHLSGSSLKDSDRTQVHNAGKAFRNQQLQLRQKHRFQKK